MISNISSAATGEDAVAALLHTLGQPIRVQILLTIATGEACVCHLEAYLGIRQAVISQHLMVLRDAGLVETRRDGRNIYYRLADPALLELFRQAAGLSGISSPDMEQRLSIPVQPCPCPYCNPGREGEISCSNLHELV